MAVIKYALMSGNQYVKSWGDGNFKLTDDVDKAQLYTQRGFVEEHIQYFSDHNFSIVKLKIDRNPIDKPIPVSNLLQDRLEELQKEFDQLDVVAQRDIEELSEVDFRRYRRLKTVLERKDISRLNW